MVNLLLNISAGFALAAIILSLVRLIKGPTTADRTVALDTMTIVSISLIVFIATLTRRIIYYDVAMVYALLSFIGVVAIARYLERGL